MRALELAEKERDDDRRRTGGRADGELAGELAVALRVDLLEQLLLELKQALGAAIQATTGLGRLDPPARPVDELAPETLLERADLQRDRRLRDAEPLGRLREAAQLDDRAECRKLACVHKPILSVSAAGTVLYRLILC